MWEVYCGGVASLRFPMFGVIGNHDHNTKAATDNEAIRPYEENIGPTNYSFDLGKLHFICLDNIIMRGDGAGGYDDGLSDEVYTWLCNDLKYVPKEKIIMICSHSSLFGKPGKDPVDVDRNGKLYADKLSEYKYVHSWAGHSHLNFNKVYAKTSENRLPNVEGHIVARATGALWLNEWVCSDGTPRGYYIVDVDGEEIEWYYHPCGNQLGVSNGFDDYYQIRAYRPGDYEDGYVYANVWGWDALWGNVLYTDNGEGSVEKRPMARYVTYDKAYKDCCDLSNSKPGNRHGCTAHIPDSAVGRGHVVYHRGYRPFRAIVLDVARLGALTRLKRVACYDEKPLTVNINEENSFVICFGTVVCRNITGRGHLIGQGACRVHHGGECR